MLHAEIDQLSDEDLAATHRAFLQARLERLTGSISAALEVARAEGQMTAESIQTDIQEHRRKHPYR